MRKPRRLTKTREFHAVRDVGQRRSDKYLVLIATATGQQTSRFGFVTSKRVGKAVHRNKVKRRLREVATVSQVEEGWDVVVIARKAAASADFNSLRESMQALLVRVGVAIAPRIEDDYGKADRCSD